MDGEGGTAAGDVGFVSLYRRFRPGRFSELRGQPHVVRALQGVVRDGRVGHAYLFSGPRGTGKTSTARILARALNCADPEGGEPCGRCPSCLDIARGASLDVHELDAASNNGVDAMRDLIAHAALGTPGRWKVYIVDEVHMLSAAAANALLKTLEEPPGHVVFVLATTDPQKVPPTIRSRTQHLEFGLLAAGTLTDLVHDVNAAAGLDLDEAALSAVVRQGRGSARDTLSALDQVAAAGGAEGLRPEVTELTEALIEEDASRALLAVARLHEAGWGPQQLAGELVDELRQSFLVSFAPELSAAVGTDRDRMADRARRIGLARLVRAIESLGRAQVDMRDAPDPRVVLEVALVRLVRPDLDESGAALADRVARLERQVSGPGAGGSRPSEVAAPTPTPHASTPIAAAQAPAPAPSPPTVPDQSPAGSEPPGSRPALGALRRRRAAGGAEPSPPSGPDPASEIAPAAQAPAPAPAPGPSPSEPATAGAPPGRDVLVEAWGDHILRGLPARAKALYSAGRFTAADGGAATFALPNAAHRDRCEEVRPVVEKAVSDHFGARVHLTLTVEDGAAGPSAGDGAARRPSGSGNRNGTGTGPGDGPGDGPGAALGIELDPDDDFDPTATADVVTSVAHAKVLEAFPGAEEVVP